MRFVAQASFNAMMFDLGTASTREEAQKICDEKQRADRARFMFDGHYWVNPDDDEAMEIK